MERREFIAFTVASLGATMCGGCIFACRPAWADDCSTTADILGPFYRSESPIRADLRYPGIKGIPLHVQGTVTSNCSTVVPSARIEVWHCDSDGVYDNTSSSYLHRGQQDSDKEGKYKFETIMPGRYLNGPSYRPSHIHFKIQAPDFEPLVTQLYFMGDPFLETDPFSSLPRARSRTLKVEKLSTGILSVSFDIGLTRAKG